MSKDWHDRPHETPPTTLVCSRQRSGPKTWIVSGCIFCSGCARFQINFRRSDIHSDVLDVHEANSYVSQCHYNCWIACQQHCRIPMLKETLDARAASVILFLIVLINFLFIRLIACHATFHGVQSLPDVTCLRTTKQSFV